MQILDEAGMNVREAEFWQGGFDLIEAMVTSSIPLTFPFKKIRLPV
jgi:hypothetical protein